MPIYKHQSYLPRKPVVPRICWNSDGFYGKQVLAFFHSKIVGVLKLNKLFRCATPALFTLETARSSNLLELGRLLRQTGAGVSTSEHRWSREIEKIILLAYSGLASPPARSSENVKKSAFQYPIASPDIVGVGKSSKSCRMPTPTSLRRRRRYIPFAKKYL